MAKKNLSCIWGFIFTILAFALMFFAAILQGHAQSVTRQGNTFIQSSNKPKKTAPTLTPYTYVIDSVSYPVYMSANGKYFIIRTSKKTGKPYKQYLPELQKQLSK